MSYLNPVSPTQAGGAPYGASTGFNTGYDLLDGVLNAAIMWRGIDASINMQKAAQQQDRLNNVVEVDERIHGTARQTQMMNNTNLTTLALIGVAGVVLYKVL